MAEKKRERKKPTPEEIREEQLKMRKLRVIVDLTAGVLRNGGLDMVEMLELTRATRALVLKLFPGKEETYDLIYKPRFDRIIKERLENN